MAIFRGLDAFWLGPEDGNACRLQSIGEIERGLTTELHENALWFFLIVNVEHVLEGERLEIKFVARVVIGRNRFRIRVHHDRFKPELAKRERSVHAAIIKLNSLADTVRPAAQDHDLAFAALTVLVLVAISRVVIRRVSFEFRRAGIDKPIGRNDVCGFSFGANLVFGCAACDRQLSIRKAKFFRAKQFVSGSALVPSVHWPLKVRQAPSRIRCACCGSSGGRDVRHCTRDVCATQTLQFTDNLLHVSQKPFIDLC